MLVTKQACMPTNNKIQIENIGKCIIYDVKPSISWGYSLWKRKKEWGNETNESVEWSNDETLEEPEDALFVWIQQVNVKNQTRSN